jgi:hypothetical protein
LSGVFVEYSPKGNFLVQGTEDGIYALDIRQKKSIDIENNVT